MRIYIGYLVFLALTACSAPPEQTASNSSPAPIDPGIYQPYDKATFPKAFKQYGTKGFKRINALRIAAAEAVAKKSECDSVDIADLSENRSTAPNSPVVFIDCRNGTRFYFSEADIGTTPISEREKGSTISAIDAEHLCTQAVKLQLKYPTEFDKKWLTVSSRQAETTGNWVIDFDFKAMNGLGINMPASAHCTIDTSQHTEVTIIQ